MESSSLACVATGLNLDAGHRRTGRTSCALGFRTRYVNRDRTRRNLAAGHGTAHSTLLLRDTYRLPLGWSLYFVFSTKAHPVAELSYAVTPCRRAFATRERDKRYVACGRIAVQRQGLRAALSSPCGGLYGPEAPGADVRSAPLQLLGYAAVICMPEGRVGTSPLRLPGDACGTT